MGLAWTTISQASREAGITMIPQSSGGFLTDCVLAEHTKNAGPTVSVQPISQGVGVHCHACQPHEFSQSEVASAFCASLGLAIGALMDDWIGYPENREGEEVSTTNAYGWDDEYDLERIMSGDWTPPEPRYLYRSDGLCMLYPGKTHAFNGESESGKSWLGLLAVKHILEDGGKALFLDFESDPATIVERLTLMHVERDDILRGLIYRRPELDHRKTSAAQAGFDKLLRNAPEVSIIDGVTAAVTLYGFSGRDEDDIAGWQRVLPDRFAKHGSAVAMIDHVTKSRDARGRFAVGSQQKMNGLTGASYTIDVLEPFGRGMRGVAEIRVAKDRAGYIRPRCGDFRASDRTQEFGHLVVDSRSPEHAYTKLVCPGEHIIVDDPDPIERKIKQLDDLGVPLGISYRAARGYGARGKDDILREALARRDERHGL